MVLCTRGWWECAHPWMERNLSGSSEIHPSNLKMRYPAFLEPAYLAKETYSVSLFTHLLQMFLQL